MWINARSVGPALGMGTHSRVAGALRLTNRLRPVACSVKRYNNEAVGW
jgi:hypothetical protein